MVIVKAALLFSALCTCASISNAFVPTACLRPTSTNNRCASVSRAAAATRNPAITSHSIIDRTVGSRAAHTSLFSSPTASNEAAPVSAVTPSADVLAKAEKKKAGTIQVAAYFGLWYLFNIGYNIYNKRLLNVYPLPWLIASAQLGIGLLYVFPLWLTKLRKAPKLAKGSLGPLRCVFGQTTPSLFCAGLYGSVRLILGVSDCTVIPVLSVLCRVRIFVRHTNHQPSYRW